ncbi:iron-containing alcohol dehydrogenase [Terricaulis sp.]|uniref:iron-containing alcohol dehydrogenase n=1 Tax=Terricaulis sp. TaxID=2768686 RepID=UPI002AC5FF9B|nr:iron-containing alcohol dehydrogenase [Terricaulis sp.]MDZ4692810.1 iron-containing alcohol dehydrogenase [Terricaulis sp.]
MAQMNYLTQCTFDFGALAQLPKILKAHGVTKPFVVTDPGLKANGLLDTLLAALAEPPAGVFTDTPANPTESASEQAAAAYRASGADGVIAFGGGSSMDLAKAMGLMVTHEGPFERLGGSQRGMRFITKIPPLIAVPTTAGTGSEVSPGAVVILNNGRKETFVSAFLVPVAAVCDPELTLGLPPLLTAATGMDAMTHCIEAVLTPVVHPPAEAIGLDGAERINTWIERAVKDGSDRDARWHMMMGSFQGALAFAKGLGAVHGLSHALGRIHELKLHHGTLNAVILPHSLAMIGDAQPEKFARLRRALGLGPNGDLAQAISDLNARIGLPASLSAMGVTEAHWPSTRDYAVSDLATLSNAIPFDGEKYDELFKRAL